MRNLLRRKTMGKPVKKNAFSRVQEKALCSNPSPSRVKNEKRENISKILFERELVLELTVKHSRDTEVWRE